MSQFESFRYRCLDELVETLEGLGISLPRSDDFSVLFDSVWIQGKRLPNRFVVQPMEGCDCNADGSPTALVRRRYHRFAAGGSGLVWCEACAVDAQGRANPRQMMLTEANVGKFAGMLDDCRAAARKTMGAEHTPVFILQLTHSGRYSKPKGKPAPIIAHHSPVLDPLLGISPEYPLITDDELQRLQNAYLTTASLAYQAGFDGVDVKACHGYLLSELLAAFTRQGSRFGGEALENRSRMIREIHQRISSEFPNWIVTSRMNAYDPVPYPYGWGCDRNDFQKWDLGDPITLIAKLQQQGAECVNITIGNPYYLPHYNRPYDTPISGFQVPDEHPLVGVNRMLQVVREVQQALPDMSIVGSGYSYLRQFMPWFAAGSVKSGWASLIGLGRGALAYPDFVRDIADTGSMNPFKTCITCSNCTQIMRDGGTAGCVIRDDEVYGPVYREGRRWVEESIRRAAERCRSCVAPTCQLGCPAGIDVPAFLAAAAEGEFRNCYEILRRHNSLPEMCAYVCPAEVQCEGHCIEKTITGTPVPIRDIQLFVCRMAREQGWVRIQTPKNLSAKRIAVVGGGPAGMGCACRLLERGYCVTVFEASDCLGGVGRQTIPAYRLSDEAVERELMTLLSTADRSRLELRIRCALGKEISLDQLREEYDAVFIGIGLWRTVSLVPEGRRIIGVESALDFLRRMKQDPEAGLRESVAVLGGGNSAIDAALTAKLHGALDVYLVYRRSFDQMPCWQEGRREALDVGVHFLVLTQPTGYVTDEHNRVQGLKTVRTVLGSHDSSGRRRAVAVPESESVLEVRWVVEALGQKSQEGAERVLSGVCVTEDGLISIDKESMETSLERVYAGGDIVNGGTTIVQAIAEGMRAAESIDDRLRAEDGGLTGGV